MTAMDPSELRVAGADVLDWVASYLEGIESLPVQTSVAPGWVRAQLPAHAPEEPEDWDVILADLDRVIVPAMTNWQSPNWFAFFPANSSPPSVLGDLVASGLGVQGMLWATGPACTEVEQHVLDWLLELLGLPFHRFSSFGAGGGVIPPPPPREPALGVGRQPVRRVGRPRPSARPRGRRPPPSRRVHVRARALVGREGPAHRRAHR
jgi:hypothetical protein